MKSVEAIAHCPCSEHLFTGVLVFKLRKVFIYPLMRLFGSPDEVGKPDSQRSRGPPELRYGDDVIPLQLLANFFEPQINLFERETDLVMESKPGRGSDNCDGHDGRQDCRP